MVSKQLCPSRATVCLAHEISFATTSVSSLNVVYAALKWLHSMLPGHNPNPVNSDFCSLTLQAAKRQVGKPIIKKKPVTAQIIREIVDKYSAASCSLTDLRTATFCTLVFAGFFRVGELRAMQPNQITFHDNYIEIKVPRSKTDVYREGNVVYISRFKSKYCPAELILRYCR